MSAPPLPITLCADLPDHADALRSVLRHYASQLEHLRSAEDVARELLPIIRIAARLT